jgi:hypothetical protein
MFDAALNYLWDEVISHLRNKVAQFDVAFFFDSVITSADRRARFKDENDLEKLEDWELIKGCREVGILSGIGYKHLDFIRDIRNLASAAHPNMNEITGLQLASYLDTCINEVLSKEPSGAAIEIKKLLISLREEELDATDAEHIAAGLMKIHSELASFLFRAIFGMYTDDRLESRVRNNTDLIAKDLWEVCPEEARYEAGVKLASFNTNAQTKKADLARAFLERVNGLHYLPSDTLAVFLSQAMDELWGAHRGINNFYYEPPFARALKNLVPPSGEIPKGVLRKYVKVLTMCKIGNGYGVSWAAEQHYDDMIKQWDRNMVIIFLLLLLDGDLSARMERGSCVSNYKKIAGEILGRTSNEHIKAALEFVMKFPDMAMDKIANDTEFQRIAGRIGKLFQN